jgi:hypothetical protein
VDLGGTPNYTVRSVIDNPMVDSGLYSIIGEKSSGQFPGLIVMSH